MVPISESLPTTGAPGRVLSVDAGCLHSIVLHFMDLLSSFSGNRIIPCASSRLSSFRQASTLFLPDRRYPASYLLPWLRPFNIIENAV
jgi:hypothetical protein